MEKDKPKIIQAGDDGELQDFLHDSYETIDHDKHEEEVMEE